MQVGGAATHTAGVINGLVDNGIAVEVVAADRPLGADRACFVQVPRTRRRPLQLIPGLGFTDFTDQLLRAAAALRADFVYQRHQLGSYAGLRLAERLGVPLVLEFNGPELWLQRNWGSGHVRFGGHLAELERRNLIDASLVVVVSEALRDSAIAEGAAPARVLVNPNGVDIDELAPYRARTASEWRARRGLPDEPTVGFVGTFGPWHGVTLLPALVEAVPDARWIFIGDGDLFPEVEAEIVARGVEDRVRLTGLVKRTEALELLGCCDICVSPHVPNRDGTPFFGSPTKLFEYMGLRKPIVASDLGQIGQVLTHERTALLCTPGDVEDAAHAARRLLADEELRERLAYAALELATTEYTWTAHVKRILDALLVGVSEAGAGAGTAAA
jgi:glycosyltransferase involved in cell wall biosynthesis